MHAHALSLLPDILNYKWAALIDADEIRRIRYKPIQHARTFLTWHETQLIDALALCWAMFVADMEHRPRIPSTLQHYTRAGASRECPLKTLFRPAKFCNARAHFPFATMGMHYYYRSEFGALHHHPGVASRDPSFATHPSAEDGLDKSLLPPHRPGGANGKLPGAIQTPPGPGRNDTSQRHANSSASSSVCQREKTSSRTEEFSSAPN